jgi:hypothetical protein
MRSERVRLADRAESQHLRTLAVAGRRDLVLGLEDGLAGFHERLELPTFVKLEALLDDREVEATD